MTSYKTHLEHLYRKLIYCKLIIFILLQLTEIYILKKNFILQMISNISFVQIKHILKMFNLLLISFNQRCIRERRICQKLINRD